MASACSIRVRGVVQGVGFRPFVYRLARANTLNGWVLNAEEGVEIHLEGAETGLEAFVRDLKAQPERIHHPHEPASGTTDGSNFTGPAGLR
jgi:hydrogenase maturation protein HypF